MSGVSDPGAGNGRFSESTFPWYEGNCTMSRVLPVFLYEKVFNLLIYWENCLARRDGDVR